MSSLNRVQLIGNLGSDPEQKQFDSGAMLVEFSVATSKKWTDKQSGELKEKTQWTRVKAWNKLAEIIAKYVKKGSKIFVEGEITTDSYESNGETRYTTYVNANNLVMLGKNSGDDQTQGEKSFSAPNSHYDKPADQQNGDDDDVPF